MVSVQKLIEVERIIKKAQKPPPVSLHRAREPGIPGAPPRRLSPPGAAPGESRGEGAERASLGGSRVGEEEEKEEEEEEEEGRWCLPCWWCGGVGSLGSS